MEEAHFSPFVDAASARPATELEENDVWWVMDHFIEGKQTFKKK